MESKMTFIIKYFIIIFFLTKTIKTKNEEIIITLQSKRTHFIFCDDKLNYFGTQNISIYKLIGDKEIDISDKTIKNKTNHYNNNECKNKVYYSTELENEKIKIIFKTFPKNLQINYSGIQLLIQ